MTILPDGSRFFIASIHGIAMASHPPLPRSGSGGWRVSCPTDVLDLFLFFSNLKYFQNSPGEVSWGSFGLLLGLWNPVGLEKLVDSLTCKLSP